MQQLPAGLQGVHVRLVPAAPPANQRAHSVDDPKKWFGQLLQLSVVILMAGALFGSAKNHFGDLQLSVTQAAVDGLRISGPGKACLAGVPDGVLLSWCGQPALMCHGQSDIFLSWGILGQQMITAETLR